MDKHIIYESQAQANADQFWTEIACSAGAYRVYQILIGIAVVWAVIWFLRRAYAILKKDTQR